MSREIHSACPPNGGCATILPPCYATPQRTFPLTDAPGAPDYLRPTLRPFIQFAANLQQCQLRKTLPLAP